MSCVSLIENEATLLGSIASRIQIEQQLPKDDFTSNFMEYRATNPSPATMDFSRDNAAALNLFSGVGRIDTEDVQVILQAVVPRPLKCRVGEETSFAVITHNSRGQRITSGGRADLFEQVDNPKIIP